MQWCNRSNVIIIKASQRARGPTPATRAGLTSNNKNSNLKLILSFNYNEGIIVQFMHVWLSDSISGNNDLSVCGFFS